MDDATEEALGSPELLWLLPFKPLFRAMVEDPPAAVGIDLSLPQKDRPGLVHASLEALLDGIEDLRPACPVVLSAVENRRNGPSGLAGEGLPGRMAHSLLPENLGVAEWTLDRDLTIRRFSESFKLKTADGSTAFESRPTFVGQLARSLGRRVVDGWLNYRVGGRIETISFGKAAAMVEQGATTEVSKLFRGKVVLIAKTTYGEDLHRQVVDLGGWSVVSGDRGPGVYLHAQALRGLLSGSLIHPVGLTWIGCLSVVLAGLGWWLSPKGWWAIAVLAITSTGLFGVGLWLQAQNLFLAPGGPLGSLWLGFAVPRAWTALDDQRERFFLRRTFDGYVSPGVLQEILAGRMDPGLAGQRAFLCVLFCDLRGYTSFSEHRAPEDIIHMLNRYYDKMSEEIHAELGTVVKFMGDGIMAHFGHPTILDNPCEHGFRAAQGLLKKMAALNQELAQRGIPPLALGVGLHAGEVVVGHLGSKGRHEYTSTGDVVNVTSRLEGMTKELGYPVILSGTIEAAIVSNAEVTALGVHAIRGRAPMSLFGWRPASAEDSKEVP